MSRRGSTSRSQAGRGLAEPQTTEARAWNVSPTAVNEPGHQKEHIRRHAPPVLPPRSSALVRHAGVTGGTRRWRAGMLVGVSRRRTIYLLVAVIAVVGSVIVGRHLTAASATATTSHRTTTVAQAEARATLLLERAAVGQLDKQGEAELRGLIRKYHLTPTGPTQCTEGAQTGSMSELSCSGKLGFKQAS